MALSSILYFIYALLGIGIIIFIHELGHFLAAKRVGVRVDTFCVGFDPVMFGRRMRLFSIRRGETDYAIGAIPFGGYVKMAGETALDHKNQPDRPPRSDELIGKSPGQRAFVFAAGAAFNVISAFIFFILAFSIGVNFTAPQIGKVEPGRPAWHAGLRPGDRVVAINGSPVTDFIEIAVASALGDPEEPRHFEVQRRDQTFSVDIVPAWFPENGYHTIGVEPALAPEIRGVTAKSAAERAGIRKGDIFIGVKLAGLLFPGPESILSLGDYFREHPGSEFQVGVRRREDGREEWMTIRLERKQQVESKPMLGIMPAEDVAATLRPGWKSDGKILPGDRVVSLAGKPASSLRWVKVVDSLGTQGPVEVELESLTGEARRITVDAGDLIRWSLDREIAWKTHRLAVGKVLPASPLAQHLKPGDVVVAVGAKPIAVFEPDDLRKHLPVGGELVVWYRRAGKVEKLSLAPAPLTRDLGIEWNLMPPVQVLAGRVAEKAGMIDGSRIIEIGGKPIRTWEELQSAVQGSTKELSIRWVEPGGQERQALVDPRSGERSEGYEELGIGLDFIQNKVKAGILESFALGAKRTVVVGQHVFLTLKGLLSRQVSAKNLAGPVGIMHLMYQVSEHGEIGRLIYFLALISVNLGLFNLLPFPILDGGHLLFLLIEKIKGSPVDVRIQEIAATVAFFLIIGLALFVTYNDIVRIFGR